MYSDMWFVCGKQYPFPNKITVEYTEILKDIWFENCETTKELYTLYNNLDHTECAGIINYGQPGINKWVHLDCHTATELLPLCWRSGKQGSNQKDVSSLNVYSVSKATPLIFGQLNVTTINNVWFANGVKINDSVVSSNFITCQVLPPPRLFYIFPPWIF